MTNVDLIHYVKNFNPWSPHHHAAFNELMRHIPEEQLKRDADWVTIYNEEAQEWKPDELSF